MKLSFLLILCCGFCFAFSAKSFNVYNHGVDIPTQRPLIIAHRGSSGVLPEHTLEAYRLAIDQGADIIECDVSITKDLKLVCLHDAFLSNATNVEDLFPEVRKNTYPVYGENITDYFIFDFTWSEVQTLSVKQRFADFRDTRYDFLYKIPTLEEYIMVAKNADRHVGLYTEVKESHVINNLPSLLDKNTTAEELVVDVFNNKGYKSPTDSCFLQSFQEHTIEKFHELTNLPLVQLVGFIPENMTYLNDSLLEKWSKICYGVGPSKSFFVEMDENRTIVRKDEELASRIHSFGLKIHPWTFRNEYNFLPFEYGQDPYEEMKYYYDLGIDGYFTDFPQSLYNFLENADVSSSQLVMSSSIVTTAAIVFSIFSSYYVYI